MTDKAQSLLNEARELLAQAMRAIDALETEIGLLPLAPSEQVPTSVAQPQPAQAPVAPKPPKDFLQDELEAGNLLTVRQVSKILGLTDWGIYKLVKESRLPVTRVGTRVKFKPTEIAGYVKRRSSGPRVIKQST
jgi:excisionase family DNA binding protein